MSSFTPSGSAGVPQTIDFVVPNTLSISTLELTAADTDYSFTFPNGTKSFLIKLREDTSKLRIYKLSGSLEFFTLPKGVSYSESEVDASGLTLFVQSTEGAQTLEILSWA